MGRGRPSESRSTLPAWIVGTAKGGSVPATDACGADIAPDQGSSATESQYRGADSFPIQFCKHGISTGKPTGGAAVGQVRMDQLFLNSGILLTRAKLSGGIGRRLLIFQGSSRSRRLTMDIWNLLDLTWITRLDD